MTTIPLTAVLLLPFAGALAAPPELTATLPRGMQRGVETALELRGARLDRPLELMFHRAGIVVTRLEPIDAQAVRAVVQAQPAAEPGLYPARLRTAAGVSNIKLLSVGSLPEIAETEPNSDRAQPQAVTLPVTINGRITAEDVDRFAFDASAGQVLAFEIEALRLGDTLFDPVLELFDAAGNRLAAADDTPLLLQDAAIVAQVPAAGRYSIAVHETAYGGNDACHYRLHAGVFPRPLAAVPAGGHAGSQLEVTWIGDPTCAAQSVKLPPGVTGLVPVWPAAGGAVSPTAVPIYASAFPSAVEAEPNNADDAATPLAVPGGAAGVIAGERDVDCFVFDGKKGQALEARVFARRLRSPLDAVVTVRRQKGADLARNDDAAGPDSAVRFTCPEDGRYVVEVRDLLHKAGAAFTYYLEIAPPAPAVSLTVPTPDVVVNVAAGNRAALLVTANRADFSGPLAFVADSLPAGVQLHSDLLPAGVAQFPLVFEARADAAPAGALVDLAVRHADPANPVSGRLQHGVKLIDLNNAPFYAVPVDRLALAVAEPLPFSIELIEPKAPLVRRGVMALPLRVTRASGFAGKVEARLIWNPPGVGSGTLTLAGDQSQGVITINAAENAAVGTWKLVAVASADLGGTVEVASAPVNLRVAEPLVEFAIARTRTELGKPVDLPVAVTTKTPFEGPVTADLLGLPPKVAATQATFTKDDKELRFALTVDAAAPAGWHQGIFVRAIVTCDGQPVVHHSPAGLLILDAPLPPPDPAAEAARAEARRKAEEEKARKKAERIAAAEKRRAERAAKAQSDKPGK